MTSSVESAARWYDAGRCGCPLFTSLWLSLVKGRSAGVCGALGPKTGDTAAPSGPTRPLILHDSHLRLFLHCAIFCYSASSRQTNSIVDSPVDLLQASVPPDGVSIDILHATPRICPSAYLETSEHSMAHNTDQDTIEP
jgi:hypothetical protein